MPIHVPGYRSQKLQANKEEIKSTLSLTPLIDLFVVLAAFLLQQFLQNGEAVELQDSVALPQASIVKPLRPSLVIVLSKEKIAVNNTKVATFDDLKNQKQWIFAPLLKALKKEIVLTKEKDSKKANNNIKVTIQADKDIDFLSIKKIMYTITESGLSEMSFAVIKKIENK
ncbi:MAG: hypothetical protein HAW63_01835 [Bdellovibrionaceae bacterium]|nr:hypothetical protein [Pseudobdellovibrionaceae bacterium]